MAVNVGSSKSSSGGEVYTSFSVDSAKTGEIAETKALEKLKAVVQEEEARSDAASEGEKRAQLQDWAERMNRVVKENVKFNFSEELGSIYVTVVDSSTNEVIRTIPTEDALQLSAIWRDAVGNIFDRKG